MSDSLYSLFNFICNNLQLVSRWPNDRVARWKWELLELEHPHNGYVKTTYLKDNSSNRTPFDFLKIYTFNLHTPH